MKNPNISIKTEEDYDKLSKFAYDLSFKENKTVEEETVLNLICDLLDQWDEKQGYTMDMPDPIDVILHEIDAQNLTRKDLIPYIGCQSKVSEVLNRKRPLSKNMIIALHEGLGIPYEALMKDSVIPAETLFNSQLTALEPIVKQKEIQEKFGWYVSDFLQFIASLFNKLGGEEALPKMGLARKNDENRAHATTDRTRLFAWYLRVLELAHEEIEIGYPKFTNIDATFIQQVARCSHFNDVAQAKQLLRQKGIILVYVPHLKKTYLDASVLFYKNHPVIGITLRYNRADNFWFTLCHELAHVLHDIDALKTNTIFTDDITLDISNDVNGIEHRANETASNSLIPPEEWYQQIGSSIPSISKIALLASKWQIHPAIIAGRIQRERKDYRLLTEFKKDTNVKQYFL